MVEMGEKSSSGLVPEYAYRVVLRAVQLLDDELGFAEEMWAQAKADFEVARADRLSGMAGNVGEARIHVEALERRVGTLRETFRRQNEVVLDLRRNRRDIVKLQREMHVGRQGRDAEAGGGTGGSVPELGESEDTPEMGESEDTPRIGRSEDAGLGNAAGAPWSPGPSGLQPIDRMERLEDDGRARNAEGAEAPPLRMF